MRIFVGALLVMGLMTGCGGGEMEQTGAETPLATSEAAIEPTVTCAMDPELCPPSTQCCVSNRGYNYRCVDPGTACPTNL